MQKAIADMHKPLQTRKDHNTDNYAFVSCHTWT